MCKTRKRIIYLIVNTYTGVGYTRYDNYVEAMSALTRRIKEEGPIYGIREITA